jgi:hypothetical protein
MRRWLVITAAAHSLPSFERLNSLTPCIERRQMHIRDTTGALRPEASSDQISL